MSKMTSTPLNTLPLTTCLAVVSMLAAPVQAAGLEMGTTRSGAAGGALSSVAPKAIDGSKIAQAKLQAAKIDSITKSISKLNTADIDKGGKRVIEPSHSLATVHVEGAIAKIAEVKPSAKTKAGPNTKSVTVDLHGDNLISFEVSGNTAAKLANAIANETNGKNKSGEVLIDDSTVQLVLNQAINTQGAGKSNRTPVNTGTTETIAENGFIPKGGDGPGVEPCATDKSGNCIFDTGEPPVLAPCTLSSVLDGTCGRPRTRPVALVIPSSVLAEDRDPLDRPLLSLGDLELRNQQFGYIDPFFINRGDLNLSVLGSGGQRPAAPVVTNTAALSPEQLGSLAPAAGGNLGDLAPSAGGLQGDTNVNCANAFLDGTVGADCTTQSNALQ